MFDLNLVPVPFQGGEEGPDQIPTHVQVEEDGGALEEEALFDLHMNPGKLQSFLYPSLDCMLMYFTLPLNLQENNDAFEEERNHLVQEGENVGDEQHQIPAVQVEEDRIFDLNVNPGKLQSFVYFF
jgi:hypothetical protein